MTRPCARRGGRTAHGRECRPSPADPTSPVPRTSTRRLGRRRLRGHPTTRHDRSAMPARRPLRESSQPDAMGSASSTSRCRTRGTSDRSALRRSPGEHVACRRETARTRDARLRRSTANASIPTASKRSSTSRANRCRSSSKETSRGPLVVSRRPAEPCDVAVSARPRPEPPETLAANRSSRSRVRSHDDVANQRGDWWWEPPVDSIATHERDQSIEVPAHRRDANGA